MLANKIDTIDRFLIVALALTAAALIAILVRYPSNNVHLYLVLAALGILAATAIFIVFAGSRRALAEEQDKRAGVWVGGIAGLLWVLEISFNNFIDPRISTAGARFYVDNSFWAVIGVAILAVALVRALRSRRVSAGVRVGFWSGMISGTIACLMGLLLILFGMRFLLRDPINISEYAVRSGGTPASGMATYFAYETMAGSLGHLFVLGIGMGLILGLLGGVIGRLLAGRPAPESQV